MQAATNMVWTLVLVLLVGCGPSGAPAATTISISEPDLTDVEPSVQADIAKHRGAAEDSGEVSEKERSELYGRLGITYEKYDFFDAARECYEQAQEEDDADHRWPYYLGRIHYNQGRLDDSLAHFQRCYELGQYLPALVLTGTVELKRQQFAAAREAYQSALESDPQCAPAIFGLGRVASAERQWQEAVDHFERARAMDAGASEVNYALGLAYRHLGQLDRARTFMEKQGHIKFSLDDPLGQAVLENVAGWRYHQNLGTSFIREDKLGLAEQSFTRAIEAAPTGELSLPLANRGAVRIMMADYLQGARKQDRAWQKIQEARQDLDRAVALNANQPRTLANYGRVLSLFGEDDKAAEYYRESIILDDQQIESHLNLGNCYRRLGRFQDAIPCYDKVLEMFPADATARVALGLTYIRLGQLPQAFEVLEEGQEVLENPENVNRVLARLLAGKPRNALDTIRAAKLAQDIGHAEVAAGSPVPSPQTLVTMVIANTHMGKFEEAARLVEKGLEIAGRKIPELTVRLERYRELIKAKQKIEETWPVEHPSLSPPALR